jgi:hypothetical protein
LEKERVNVKCIRKIRLIWEKLEGKSWWDGWLPTRSPTVKCIGSVHSSKDVPPVDIGAAHEILLPPTMNFLASREVNGKSKLRIQNEIVVLKEAIIDSITETDEYIYWEQNSS